jgi:hypothetical protein
MIVTVITMAFSALNDLSPGDAGMYLPPLLTCSNDRSVHCGQEAVRDDCPSRRDSCFFCLRTFLLLWVGVETSGDEADGVNDSASAVLLSSLKVPRMLCGRYRYSV